MSAVLPGSAAPAPAAPRAVRFPWGLQLPTSWRGISLREAPGWLVSLSVHLVAFLALLAFKFHTDRTQDQSLVSMVEDVKAEEFVQTTAEDQVGTSEVVTSLTASGNGIGGPAPEATASAQQEIQQRVDDEFKVPDAPITDDAGEIGPDDLVGRIEPRGGSVVNVAQGEGGGDGGVAGAIDRLTLEIAQSLRQAKTTVIWLFDQSLSLKERRDAIADRFENVYRQLESMGEGGKGSLTTVAATYGDKFNLLTDKPVEDVKSLIPKVRTIKNDPSGRENVFAAVNMLAQRFRSERAKKRNVMIFIVTDEKGDDAEKHLEETVLLCRRAGIKVYTVGNAALFGREKGYVNWRYEDGYVEELEVDAGPETFLPESIALGFWGGRGPDLSRMSSGYGPYALTRLCTESGGLYLIAQEDAKGRKFNPAVMRNYQPDYRPIRDYTASLSKNKAKMSLVEAARQAEIRSIPLPRLGFPAYNDTVLREEITEAQKPAAELTDRIERLLSVLQQGEKDREKVTEPRWRAAYDLAIGRALAMKVRLYGYNKMLATMKGTPETFQRKDSNEWRIEPSKAINAGQDVKKLEKQATTYLKRVMDEHPETPWALLAERELSTPLGWEWQERNNPSILPANTSMEEARRRIQLAEEEAMENAKKRPPPAPQRERPKL